jgi:hypothetical protein
VAADYDDVKPDVAESRHASLAALKEANSPDARSVVLELDEADTVDGVELPGADLSGEEIIIHVIPQGAAAWNRLWRDRPQCLPAAAVPHGVLPGRLDLVSVLAGTWRGLHDRTRCHRLERGRGWRARFLAGRLFPELFFDMFLNIVYVKGIIDISLGRTANWKHVTHTHFAGAVKEPA